MHAMSASHLQINNNQIMSYTAIYKALFIHNLILTSRLQGDLTIFIS